MIRRYVRKPTHAFVQKMGVFYFPVPAMCLITVGNFLGLEIEIDDV